MTTAAFSETDCSISGEISIMITSESVALRDIVHWLNNPLPKVAKLCSDNTKALDLCKSSNMPTTGSAALSN